MGWGRAAKVPGAGPKSRDRVPGFLPALPSRTSKIENGFQGDLASGLRPPHSKPFGFLTLPPFGRSTTHTYGVRTPSPSGEVVNRRPSVFSRSLRSTNRTFGAQTPLLSERRFPAPHGRGQCVAMSPRSSVRGVSHRSISSSVVEIRLRDLIFKSRTPPASSGALSSSTPATRI